MMHIILELARHGILKTHIMYRANLSFKQLNKFLELLCNQQLLKHHNGAYVTTQRGQAFIDSFHTIQVILGELPQVHAPSYPDPSL